MYLSKNQAYAVAPALVIAALALRALFDPWLGDAYPLVFLYAAIAAGAILGGTGPGLVAAILGYAGANWLFVAPRYAFDLPTIAEAAGLAAYGFTTAIIVALGALARHYAGLVKEERDRYAAQHQLLDVTLKSIGDAVIATDAQARVTFLNPIAEQLTGWPVRDAVGRPLDEVFVIVNEQTRRPAANPATRALAEGRIVGLANHTIIIARDGRETPIDDSAAPIRYAEGRIAGAVLVFRDVSTHKEAEQALKAADRQKDEFIGVLAHELRNPLSPISNAVQVLKERGADPRHAAWAADMIGRQVRQLSALLDDLLDTARIAQRKLRLDVKRVMLENIVREAVEANQPQLAQRRHRLTLDLDLGPLEVDGDAVRLTQIFSNLLHNAAKFTPEGGEIRVTGRRIDAHASITVADNGVGIAPEDLHRIFLMYAQVGAGNGHRAGRGTAAGLGIGLALARMLTEMHGGRLTATSAGRGHGSSFTVLLPIAVSGSRDAGREPPSEGSLTSRPAALDVLIVEDQPDLRESLTALLELAGHRVRSCDTAAAALAACAERAPDVAILDLGLPDLSGVDLGRRLRDRLGARLVLIALTGWGHEELRGKTREAGFDYHLTKPLADGELQAILALASSHDSEDVDYRG